MNTKLRKEAKNEFEKDFFKLMNNSIFGKIIENVRNHRGIKLVTTNETRKNQFQNQIITQQNIFRKFVGNRNEKKTEVIMNKPVYLGMSVLNISKALMYELWYDYIKPKYEVMMIRDCRHLIELQHIYMEEMQLKCVRVKF